MASERAEEPAMSLSPIEVQPLHPPAAAPMLSSSRSSSPEKLLRANSETWTDSPAKRPLAASSATAGSAAALVPSAAARKDEALPQVQQPPARSPVNDTSSSDSSSAASAAGRKQRPVLPNLDIVDDNQSQFSVDEVELSAALTELTVTVTQENLKGVAMRHPPEVVRDRLQRVARSIVSIDAIDGRLDSADTDAVTLIRFVGHSESPQRPQSAASSRGRAHTLTEVGSHESPSKLAASPTKLSTSDDESLRYAGVDEKVVAVDDNATIHTALPTVLQKCNIHADLAPEYCLVAIDSEGTERLVGDEEVPLAIVHQHPDIVFRLRRRKTLELQNYGLFKQIMEEEGQQSSLEYLQPLEAAASVSASVSSSVDQSNHPHQQQKETSKLPASASTLTLNDPNFAAAEAATLQYYEKYQATADVNVNRNVQWELIGMPMNVLLTNTLANLDQQINHWQKKANNASGENSKLVNGLLASLKELYSTSQGAYRDLMDTVEKDVPLILPIKGYRIESCLFSAGSQSVLTLGLKSSASREIPSSPLKETPSKQPHVADAGEGGPDTDLLPIVVDPSEPIFHHANNYPVYRAYFYDSRHLGGQLNFVGNDAKMGPMCVSVAKETDSEGTPRLRVLLWTRDGSHVRFLKHINATTVRGEALADLLTSKLLSNNSNGAPSTPTTPLPSKEQIFSWVPDEDFSKALLKLEADQLEIAYKIGVLYVKNGQVREDEMFGNVETSPAFEEFLNILGDRVELKNWPNYKAGLDTIGNSNGTHSIYTKWRNVEVMYHVSTLLPFDPSDVQQLGRKRHIGNDILVILFVDGPTSYLPDTVASRFNHVFAVVRPNPDNTYTLSLAVKDLIPAFGPEIDRKRYPRDKSFRDLLLAKLINGQNAAYRAPVFREKLRRTREFLLNDLIEKYKNSAQQQAAAQKASKQAVATVAEKGAAARFPSKMLKSFTVRKFTFGGTPTPEAKTPGGSASSLLTTSPSKESVGAAPAAASTQTASAAAAGDHATTPSSAANGVVPATSPAAAAEDSFKSRFSSSFAPFTQRRATVDAAAITKFAKKGPVDESAASPSAASSSAAQTPTSAAASAKTALSAKMRARDDFY